MPDNTDPNDCSKLYAAAELQRQAQGILQQAASIGAAVVNRLFGTVNDYMQAPSHAIDEMHGRIATTGSKLQQSIRRRTSTLRGKINASAVQLASGIHGLTSGLVNQANAGLSPEGAPPVVFPGYTPLPPGGASVVEEPAARFLLPHGQPSPAPPYHPGRPETGEARPGGFGLPLPGAEQLPMPQPDEAPFQAQLQAPPDLSIPSARPIPPVANTVLESDDSVRLFEALLQRYAPDQAAPTAQPGQTRGTAPVTQTPAAVFFAMLCRCLKGAAKETPVDLDQPLAFMFGERSDPWHAQAAAWLGDALPDILSSPSFAALMEARLSQLDQIG